MKKMLLRRMTIRLTVVGLLSLLGACSTATPRYASNRPVRDSSGPVKNPDIIHAGTRVPVTTYYDWPPIGDQKPR
jgi:hypothetical protein